MNCAQYREWLSELVDDALERERRAALLAHMAQCAECRAEFEALRRAVAQVRALGEVEVPREFLAGIRERLDGVPARRTRWRILHLPQTRVALAAAMLAVLAFYSLRYLAEPPEEADRASLLRKAAPMPPPPAEAPVPAARSEFDAVESEAAEELVAATPPRTSSDARGAGAEGRAAEGEGPPPGRPATGDSLRRGEAAALNARSAVAARPDRSAAPSAASRPEPATALPGGDTGAGMVSEGLRAGATEVADDKARDISAVVPRRERWVAAPAEADTLASLAEAKPVLLTRTPPYVDVLIRTGDPAGVLRVLDEFRSPPPAAEQTVKVRARALAEARAGTGAEAPTTVRVARARYPQLLGRLSELGRIEARPGPASGSSAADVGNAPADSADVITVRVRIAASP